MQYDDLPNLANQCVSKSDRPLHYLVGSGEKPNEKQKQKIVAIQALIIAGS